MGRTTRMQVLQKRLFASIVMLATSSAFADDALHVWLQTRDQNPFVLASGLPLAPVVPAPGRWQIDASVNEANTELLQAESHSSLLFDAETRETRISIAYAFNERWSARASLGHLWIGDGFLDSPVENFHRVFGFDNGDRGRLGTRAPTIEVRHDGELLYALQRGGSGIAPVLLDLTRSWTFSGNRLAGVSLGAKLPVGSRTRLADTDSSDVSLSAFTSMALGDRMTFGARLGVLHQGNNQLLRDLAREQVAFGGLLLAYRLDPRWNAFVQVDAHGALYRELPDFLRGGSLLSLGLSRRFGENVELLATLGEDVPATHTTDVVIGFNLRVHADRD